MNDVEVLKAEDGTLIKMWTHGLPVEPHAKEQLMKTAQMPFIHSHIAVMPDVHVGIGATIGSVIPTKGAIIPAAVGVDIGCGMMAAKTDLKASDLPDNLLGIRRAIERAVPHGVSKSRGHRGSRRDNGSWGNVPERSEVAWSELLDRFKLICHKMPEFEKTNHLNHMGTLGSGNHFIEICPG